MCLFSWFGFCLFVLCSLAVTTGQSNLICSSQPIVATAGDDVILPCRLDPPINASSRAVEWTRPGLDPKYIHVHQDGRLVYQSQNPLYNYRTTLFVDQLINGNVSLKLFRVKLSDAGEYKCSLPSLWKEASIQLIVEAASSAGDIPAKMGQSIFTSDYIPMATICAFAMVLAFVRKIKRDGADLQRKNASLQNELDSRKKEEQDMEQMVATLQEQMRGLEEMRDQLIKLLEKVEAEKEEEKDNTKRVDATLQEQVRGLEEMRDQLIKLLEKVEAEKKENRENLQSVETKIERIQSENKPVPEELIREKENLLQTQWKLDEIKRNYERLKMKMEKLLE